MTELDIRLGIAHLSDGTWSVLIDWDGEIIVAGAYATEAEADAARVEARDQLLAIAKADPGVSLIEHREVHEEGP